MTKPSLRVEQDDLRNRMRAAGMTRGEIAVAHRTPQMLRFDQPARAVLTTLLGRARGSTVSVLRGIAEQVGVPA